MKKLFKYLAGALIGVMMFTNTVNAQAATVNLWKKVGSALFPAISTWEIGSSTVRIPKIWATAADITTLTLGGTMAGNLDMNGNDILHTDSIFGSTAILPVRIGDAGTSTRGLITEDDLLVTGKLEVDDSTYIDAPLYLPSLGAAATTWLYLGGVNTTLAHSYIGTYADDGIKISVNMTDAKANGNVIITAISNIAKDHDHETASANPTLFIHSVTDPDSDNTEWLSFSHDKTDGRIQTGKGNLSIGTGSDSHTLATPNDLFVSGKLEVDDSVYLDGGLVVLGTAGSGVALIPKYLQFGGTGAAANTWRMLADHGMDQATMALGSESGRQMVITDYSSLLKDYDHDVTANPTVFFQSIVDPDVSNNNWGAFSHDQANFVMNTGANVGTGTAPTTINNGFLVALSDLTSGAAGNYGTSITRTLNDNATAGGETYTHILANITETDKTGWPTVNLMDLQVGGASKFLFSDTGDLTLGDLGSSVNSGAIYLTADNAATPQTGGMQVIYGVDPYLRLYAPNDAGTATAIMDLKDQRIVIGGGVAGVDYDLFFNGEDSDGTVTFDEDAAQFLIDQDLDIDGVLTANAVDQGAGTFEMPNGTAIPASCAIGELFQDTDSDDCANTGGGDGAVCVCKSANTWALITNI